MQEVLNVMMMFRMAFVSLAQVFENYHCVCKICHVYFEFSMFIISSE